MLADATAAAVLALIPRSAMLADLAAATVLALAPLAAVLADPAPAAVLAPPPLTAVCADLTPAALLAVPFLSAVLADLGAAAVLALSPPSAMHADPAAAAVLAEAPPSAVLADLAAAAVFALASPSAVVADLASAAVFALVLMAVVWAEDPPMAVPSHCATALATATPATTIVAGSRTIAAATVDAAIRVPRQPVDQVLLLPALRQCRLRAELLQLRDGLRADRNTRRRESATREGSLISRMNSVCKQLCARRPRRLQPQSNARQLCKQAVALCLATFVCRSASAGCSAVWAERTNEGLLASGHSQRRDASAGHRRRPPAWLMMTRSPSRTTYGLSAVARAVVFRPLAS